MQLAKQAAHDLRLAALSAIHRAKVTQPTRRGSITLRHCIKSISMMHGGVNRCSIEKTPPCYCPRHQGCSNKAATGALQQAPRLKSNLLPLTRLLHSNTSQIRGFPLSLSTVIEMQSHCVRSTCHGPHCQALATSEVESLELQQRRESGIFMRKAAPLRVGFPSVQVICHTFGRSAFLLSALFCPMFFP